MTYRAAPPDTLQHYGVLGMKWGVRRSPQKSERRADRKAARLRARTKKADMKKAVAERRYLSDQELRDRISRMKLERELKSLTEEDLAPGRSFVKKVLIQSGTKIVPTILTGAALYGVKTAVSKGKFDPDAFGSAIFNGGAKK